MFLLDIALLHFLQAMKVENMLRIKEEFDYKSLSRKLEIQLDKLIAENERQQKTFDDEVERINLEALNRVSEVERNFADALEVSPVIHHSPQWVILADASWFSIFSYFLNTFCA